MATVGHLNVNVNAKTSAFSKKMKGVRATIGRLAKGFGGMALKVAKFAAVLGGIAVAAIIALTKKGLAAVDTMAKLAQTIGSSVESIQVLRHMATLGGVSIEKMDKSILKMSRSIGEVAVFGIGEAADAFRELGISATELQKLSPEHQFGVIADALNKVSDAGEAGILAYKIFGRSGQELIVTMKEGSAGIDAMAQKLNDLGVIIGDKQAQMVEKANDAWADIGLVWQGLQNQLAVEFAPALTMIANKIVKFIKDSGGMGVVAEYIAKAFFYAGAAVLDTIRIVQIGWLGFKAAVIQVASDIVGVIAYGNQLAAESFNKLKSVGILAASAVASTWGWASGFISDTLNELEFDSAATWVRITGNVAKALAPVMADAGVAKWGESVQNDMVDFLKSISKELGDDAAATGLELLEKLAEGFSLGKVDETFESLKEKFMGKGFDITSGEGEIELTTPDFKGVADSLTTAIGSMKVEADSQSRIASQSLNVEKEHLQTSKDTLTAIRSGGVALT
jgi:hypothetical protein